MNNISFVSFFFNSNTKTLLQELLIATGLCFVPSILILKLTEQSLSYGITIAACYLILSEIYRYFKSEKENKNLK